MWRHVGEARPTDCTGLEYWSFALLFISGADDLTAVHIGGEEAFHALAAQVYVGYRALGWDGSVMLDAFEIDMISSELALASACGRRFREGGALHNAWEGCYWLAWIASALG